MKKQLISVALMGVLAMVAVSCQKENMNEWQSGVEVSESVKVVKYTVNGEMYTVAVNGEEEWDALMERMLSLTEMGYDVRIVGNSCQQGGTKEVEVKKTPDKQEAKEWSKEKAADGYTVDMTYREGEYTCVATKN